MSASLSADFRLLPHASKPFLSSIFFPSVFDLQPVRVTASPALSPPVLPPSSRSRQPAALAFPARPLSPAPSASARSQHLRPSPPSFFFLTSSPFFLHGRLRCSFLPAQSSPTLVSFRSAATPPPAVSPFSPSPSALSSSCTAPPSCDLFFPQETVSLRCVPFFSHKTVVSPFDALFHQHGLPCLFVDASDGCDVPDGSASMAISCEWSPATTAASDTTFPSRLSSLTDVSYLFSRAPASSRLSHPLPMQLAELQL